MVICHQLARLESSVFKAVFDSSEVRSEAFSAAQGHTGGEDIKNDQLHQSRRHGKYCSVSSSTFTLMQQWLLSARGEPSAVRDTIGLCLASDLSRFYQYFRSPGVEIKKNGSPTPADAASIRCISGSSWVNTGTLKRKNLCSASRATAAEVPSPKNTPAALGYLINSPGDGF